MTLRVHSRNSIAGARESYEREFICNEIVNTKRVDIRTRTRKRVRLRVRSCQVIGMKRLKRETLGYVFCVGYLRNGGDITD